jgi:hypothetical protein
MSTQSSTNWIDILRVAKLIRSSVRPVRPSAGFKRHLRADLAAVMNASEHGRRPPAVATFRRRGSAVPSLVIGASIGAVLATILLAALRRTRRSPRADG